MKAKEVWFAKGLILLSITALNGCKLESSKSDSASQASPVGDSDWEKEALEQSRKRELQQAKQKTPSKEKPSLPSDFAGFVDLEKRDPSQKLEQNPQQMIAALPLSPEDCSKNPFSHWSKKGCVFSSFESICRASTQLPKSLRLELATILGGRNCKQSALWLQEQTSLHFAAKKLNTFFWFARLNQLKKLNLSFNQATVFFAVENFSHLEELILNGNIISELPDFGHLTALRRLSIASNPIESLSAIEGLSQLKELSASFIQARDFRYLSGLANLETLSLQGNDFKDVSFIAPLKKLRYLDLSENEMIDIKGLSTLNQLRHLNISVNPVQHGDPLGSLSHLKTLDLNQTYINDLSFLKKLQSLKTLTLGQERAEQVLLLQSPLLSVKTLYLIGSETRNINGISFVFPNLEKLVLKNCELTSYAPLRLLKKLKSLELDKCVGNINPAAFPQIEVSQSSRLP